MGKLSWALVFSGWLLVVGWCELIVMAVGGIGGKEGRNIPKDNDQGTTRRRLWPRSSFCCRLIARGQFSEIDCPPLIAPEIK